MGFAVGAFFAKLGISLALSLLADQFSQRGRRIAAQKRPNEIESDGEASYEMPFLLGEAVSPGFEVFRGVETYELTDAPYSVDRPGKGRYLHLARVLSEGECEAPTGFFMGDDEWSVNDQRIGAAIGARFRQPPRVDADGSIVWNLFTSRSRGPVQLRWKLAANGQQSQSLADAVALMDDPKLPWDLDHRLEGRAWVHIRLNQPPIDNIQGDVKWPDELPDMSFLAKGKKLAIPGPGAPSTWPVRFTRNAAAVLFWYWTEFRGVPIGRIDLPSVRNAYRVCARTMDLGASHLADIRRSYRPTAMNVAPAASNGNAYPPGGGWSVDTRNTSDAMPYVWVQFQSRTGNVWSAWGGVRRFRAQVTGGGDDPDNPRQPETEKLAVSASRQVNHEGGVIYTPDPSTIQLVRNEDDPERGGPNRPEPPPDPTDPDPPVNGDDDMLEIPPDKATGDPEDPYLGLLLGDAQFMVYSVNGLIASGDLQNLDQLSAELNFCWAGSVVDDGGKLFFRPGEDSAPVANFNDRTGETIYVETSPPITERINAVTMELAASRVHRFGPWTMPRFINEGAHERDGRLLEKHLGTRGFVTSPAAAEVLMGIHLRAARSPRIYTRRESVANNIGALRVRPGDRVTLNDPGRELNAVTAGSPVADQGNDQGRYMRVLGKRLDVETWMIDFALVESPNGVYEPQARRFPRVEPNVTAPGAFAPAVEGFVATESSIVDRTGAVRHRTVTAWDTDAVHRTIVQWRPVVPGGTPGHRYDSLFETIGGEEVRIVATPDWSAERQLETGSGTATIAGLQEGVQYEFRARHVSLAGYEGAWSGVASVFVVGSLYPSTPTDIAASLGVDGFVRASWTNPPVALPSNWTLEFLLDAGTDGEHLYVVRDIPVSADFYDESTLALRTQFSDTSSGLFRIFPVVVLLNEDGSVNAREKLAPLELPMVIETIGVPGALSGSPTGDTIVCTFGSVVDAATYDLRWKTAAQSAYPNANLLTDLADTTGTITGLADGTAYDIQVRAVAANATGGWSGSIRVTTVIVLGLPGSCRVPRLDRGVPPESVLVGSCVAPADDGGAPITGYRWLFGPFLGAETAYATVLSTRTFSGLVAGRLYGMRVAAINSAGIGPYAAAAGRSTASIQTGDGWQYILGVWAANLNVTAQRRRYANGVAGGWVNTSLSSVPGSRGTVFNFDSVSDLHASGWWSGGAPTNAFEGCPESGLYGIVEGAGIWAGANVIGARGAGGSNQAQVRNVDTGVWAAPSGNYMALEDTLDSYLGGDGFLAGWIGETPGGFAHTGWMAWDPD